MIVLNLKKSDDAVKIGDRIFIKFGDKKNTIVIEAPKELEIVRIKEDEVDVFRRRNNGHRRD